MLTQEYLKQILFYSPQTGQLFWRVARGSAAEGSPITHKNADGYVVVQIDGKVIGAHRVAWMYVTGAWPADEIDHINGVRDDNRILNLREATHLENSHYRLPKPNSNSTGATGVQRWGNKYRATIGVKGKRIDLGLHSTVAEASAAYQSAKAKYHASNKGN